MTTLVVLAKAPVPGRSKTRLCPPCTPEEAARVADAALRDTLDVAGRSAADRVALEPEVDEGRQKLHRFVARRPQRRAREQIAGLVVRALVSRMGNDHFRRVKGPDQVHEIGHHALALVRRAGAPRR